MGYCDFYWNYRCHIQVTGARSLENSLGFLENIIRWMRRGLGLLRGSVTRVTPTWAMKLTSSLLHLSNSVDLDSRETQQTLSQGKKAPELGSDCFFPLKNWCKCAGGNSTHQHYWCGSTVVSEGHAAQHLFELWNDRRFWKCFLKNKKNHF